MGVFSALYGPILIGISAIAFGLMPIFVIMTFGSGVSTFTLLFLRFAVAAIFMFSLLFAKRLKMPTVRQILAFLLLGGIGYVGQSFCYFFALNYVPSSVGSLLLYTYPMLVMIGSVLVFKEQVTKKKVFGLLLALSGAFVIIGGQIGGEATGILLAFSAAIIYTVYILVSSRVIGEGMGIQSSAFITLGSTIVFGLMVLISGFEPPKTSNGWIGAFLIAFVSTVIAMWAFFTGMEKTGPSMAALISTLEPVVTVVASVIFLGNPLSVPIVIGGALVLSALSITTFPSKKEKLLPENTLPDPGDIFSEE